MVANSHEAAKKVLERFPVPSDSLRYPDMPQVQAETLHHAAIIAKGVIAHCNKGAPPVTPSHAFERLVQAHEEVFRNSEGINSIEDLGSRLTGHNRAETLIKSDTLLGNVVMADAEALVGRYAALAGTLSREESLSNGFEKCKKIKDPAKKAEGIFDLAARASKENPEIKERLDNLIHKGPEGAKNLKQQKDIMDFGDRVKKIEDEMKAEKEARKREIESRLKKLDSSRENFKASALKKSDIQFGGRRTEISSHRNPGMH